MFFSSLRKLTRLVYQSTRSFIHQHFPAKRLVPFGKRTRVIKKITPTQFKNILLKATLKVEEHQSFLDQINVFPVPDGDTGSNLVHTLKAVRQALEKVTQPTFTDLYRVVAEAALINARGNIGIIVSQYLRGFLNALVGVDVLTADLLLAALKQGSQTAFAALDNPRQGTVLDVLSEAARAAEGQVMKTDDLVEILTTSLEYAQKALEKTRTILPQMQKARVVDAGGAGFLYFLGGMVAGVKKSDIVISEDLQPQGIRILEEEKLAFTFCTECVLSKATIAIQDLKSQIQPLGDSVHVVNIGDTIKLHVHTNHPELVFTICQKSGKVEDWKVDDMGKMQKENLKRFSYISKQVIGEKLAIVTDTSADFPASWKNKYPIFQVDIPIFLAEDSANLSETMTVREFYKKMFTDKQFLPKTSQPNPQQFLTVYQQALSMFDRVVCLPISSKVSGTYQSAVQAKKLLDNQKVHVLDILSASAGIALFIKFIFDQKSQGRDIVDIIADVYALRERINIYYMVSNLDYLQRSGRISKGKSLLGSLLRAQPLLSLRDGKIKDTGEKILFSSPEKRRLLLARKVQEYLSDHTLENLIVIHSGIEEEATLLVEYLQDAVGVPPRSMEKMYVSKVLGSHLGPRGLGIVFV